MESQKYFSSGEFAKLTGVNKRTLHYYNDIGLFKPRHIAENGYHYYSVMQFAQLEMILILRRIGFSVEEIKSYQRGAADTPLAQMMTQKKKLIDDSIQQLLSIQAYLNQKADRIRLGMNAKHAQISLCTLSERKIILSPPITGAYDDEDFSVAAEFSARLKQLFSLYDTFGSRISTEVLANNDYSHYDRYFAYCPKDSSVYDEVLPAGTYLQAFSIGPWSNLPDVYRKIADFSKQNNLQLHGYSYEQGLNEMTLESKDDYITRIIIPVKA